MVADIRGHEVPAAGIAPARAALLNLSLSIRDPKYVANTTARAQHIADLTAASLPPTASNPVFVYRGDAPVGWELEVTENGTDWRSIPSARSQDVVAGVFSYNTVRGTDDNFSAGSFANGVTLTVAGAAAGRWSLTFQLIVSSTSGTLCHLRGSADAANITTDVPVAVGVGSRTPHTITVPHVHAGGDLAVSVQGQVGAGTGTMHAGCRVSGVWLGP